MSRQAADARPVLLDSLSERELQAAVVDGLQQRGYRVWHVVDARLMAAGLPDIVAVRAGSPLLLWELKSSTGRVRPAQRTALDTLAAASGSDVRLVRPADWDRLSERW